MEIRDYQMQLAQRAASLLKDYNIAYLALEMRVGKTITAYYTAVIRGARHVLFVTKKKAIASTRADYLQFLRDFDLDTINYEQLKNYKGNPDLVIIDEAHSCGAFPKPSERTRLLKEICQNKPIIFLSGTPTPESYSQIFHQFWISSYSPFWETNFYAWAKFYVDIKKKYFNGLSFNDYSQADKGKIDRQIGLLMLTYTQAEAGFASETTEEVLLVRMTDRTYSAADIITKKRVFTTKDGLVVLADTSVKLMQKLHQIYSGTVIVEKNPATEAVCFDASKISFIRSHFAGKKIAIFYKFKAEERMIRAHIGARVTTDPAEFNESPDIVFISQIQSGREGINLSTADALVFMNIDFSATSYIQSRARLQSKDRRTPARVYYVFAENGIEQKIYDRVVRKMNFTKSYFEKIYGIKTPDKGAKGTGEGRMVGSKDHAMLEAGVA